MQEKKSNGILNICPNDMKIGQKIYQLIGVLADKDFLESLYQFGTN